MSVEPTTVQFKKAAQMHLQAANAASAKNGGLPASAAYLAHVAAECAMKYRIISKHSRSRTQEMREVLGNKFEKIFASKEGHQLKQLANHAALERLLAADGKDQLLKSADWLRICGTDRPYSLRYGTEPIGVKEANTEVAFVTRLLESLLRTV